MKKAVLYIICGFIGAGKTTFSKKLSDETGAVHFNPDELCVRQFDKSDWEQNWEQCFSLTMDKLWKMTARYLKDGKDVILDTGFWDRKSRDFAKSVANECHADWKLYYLDVPDEVAKRRILSRTGVIAENNIKHFEEIKQLFSVPAVDENPIVIKNYS